MNSLHTMRAEALKDAEWAAHCWITDMSFGGRLQNMCPADISVGVCNAIKDAKPRPTLTRELCEERADA